MSGNMGGGREFGVLIRCMGVEFGSLVFFSIRLF